MVSLSAQDYSRARRGGRPKGDIPSKWNDRETYNAYMRRYMRGWRARRSGQDAPPDRDTDRARQQEVIQSRAVHAAAALYDPLRDGPVAYRDQFAPLLGDPPLGRSALDMIGRA